MYIPSFNHFLSSAAQKLGSGNITGKMKSAKWTLMRKRNYCHTTSEWHFLLLFSMSKTPFLHHLTKVVTDTAVQGMRSPFSCPVPHPANALSEAGAAAVPGVTLDGSAQLLQVQLGPSSLSCSRFWACTTVGKMAYPKFSGQLGHLC